MENKKCPMCSSLECYPASLCDDFDGMLTCQECNHRFYGYKKPEIKPESLYNTNNVKTTREKLLKEQEGKDLLTGLPIPEGQAVLDHNHKTQYVRGVLHRQTNAVLGKIENLWTRYLGYWYNDTLSNFLRRCADYLERSDDQRYVHPAWIKRVTTDFRKLGVKAQQRVLNGLDVQDIPTNSLTRCKAFQARLKTKKYNYEFVRDLIKGA